MRKGAVLVAALALAGPATPALAQESGVTYDPSSPAGKQYALPLDDARGTGSGGSSTTGGSALSGASSSGSSTAQSGTRFGAGITPAHKAATARHAAHHSAAKATPAPAGQEREVAATEPLSAVTARAGAEQRGVLLPVAVIAAIVAAAGGLGIRRLRRPSAS